jgi:hypothetical protein
MNNNTACQRGFHRQFKRIYASTMLFLIVGVFLLPDLVFAKMINDENIINITNATRVERGLNQLTANQLLSKAAYDKAEAIFTEQAFEHSLGDKTFSTWVKDAGYKYQNVGENLAIDFVSSEGTMKAWLASPSHKKNILNPKFKEIGVAVRTANFEGHKSILVVQIFGTPIINTQINNIQDFNKSINANQKKEMLLTNSAPQTLVVTNTKTNQNYLNKANSLYGQEYLSLEFVEEAILYIVDYGNIYLMNYYFTIIVMLLLVFSASFVRHKKNSH